MPKCRNCGGVALHLVCESCWAERMELLNRYETALHDITQIESETSSAEAMAEVAKMALDPDYDPLKEDDADG